MRQHILSRPLFPYGGLLYLLYTRYDQQSSVSLPLLLPNSPPLALPPSRPLEENEDEEGAEDEEEGEEDERHLRLGRRDSFPRVEGV